MRQVVLVVGSPSSGKTWVCEQLTDKYAYVPHDAYINTGLKSYLTEIAKVSRSSSKPVLAETPFSVSQMMEPLLYSGLDPIPVFILEDPKVLIARYFKREGKPIPKGHISRQDTYAQRAEQYGAFSGTSSEVLEYLKKIL